MKPYWFDKYLFYKAIGKGGMGEVYLGKQPGHDGVDKLVAVKTILPEQDLDPDMLLRFKNEADIARKLRHNTIIPLHEFGSYKGKPFFVMEYVRGYSLSSIFDKFTRELNQRLPIEMSLFICLKIAKGLNYCHTFVDPLTGKASPIYHRDISLQNILVSFEGDVKIIDFGVAKVDKGKAYENASTIVGKFQYMSPEQISGSQVDHRTDIFALGLILWELVQGQRAYDGLTLQKVMARIRLCSYGPVTGEEPEISEINTILSKCLQPGKNDRYQTTLELERALSVCLAKNDAQYSESDVSTFIEESFKEESEKLKSLVIPILLNNSLF